MPSVARLRSQLDSESDSSITSPIGVFTNARSSSSIDAPDRFRAFKRRKTSGLNARFDRMLEDINVYSRTSPRRRTRSSGSSSISSHDIPKTPVDAYSRLSDGRLGAKFSVIKMNHALASSKPTPWEQDKNQSIMESRVSAFDASISIYPMKSESDQLPAWLSSTLLTLDIHHPLRLLLPSPHKKLRNHDSTLITTDPGDEKVPTQLSPTIPAEGSVFAFCPPQLSKEDLLADHEPTGPEPLLLGPSLMPYRSPSPPLFPTNNAKLAQMHAIDNARSVLDSSLGPDGAPNILPFSTPGPCHHSVVSKSPLLHANARFSLDPTIVRPASSSVALFPPNLFLRPSSHDIAPEISHGQPLDDDLIYGDLTIDPNVSDSFPYDFPPSNQIPFSTPGPAYRPIYFDSPAEDPSDSDPLQPGYEVHCDTLDFRWEPFNRKGTSSTPATTERQRSERGSKFLDYQSQGYSMNNYGSTRALVDDTGANMDTNVGELSMISFPQSPNLDSATLDRRHFAHAQVTGSSPLPFDDPTRFTLHLPLSGVNDVGIPDPKPPPLPVFAPAPGIFISPLRDTSSVPSQDGGDDDIQANTKGKTNSQLGVELDHQLLDTPAYYRRYDVKLHPSNRDNGPASSQLSNDSIKSWSE